MSSANHSCNSGNTPSVSDAAVYCKKHGFWCELLDYGERPKMLDTNKVFNDKRLGSIVFYSC